MIGKSAIWYFIVTEKCVLRLSCVVHGADLWPVFSLYKGKPLYREKTVYIKTHKTAINLPVDHTGET